MTTKLTAGISAALIAGVALAGTAMAKPGGHGHGGKMGMKFDLETADTNNDGFITLEELKANYKSPLSDADTNGDGAISKSEFEAHAKQRAENSERDIDEERMAKRVDKMFKRLDDNEDGQVTTDEMPEPRFEKIFDKLDTDEDGKISAEELEAAKAKMQEKRDKMKDRKDG